MRHVRRLLEPDAAALSAVAFLSLMVALWVLKAPNTGGDTPYLVLGAQAALDCLEVGIHRECGLQPEGQLVYRSTVGPWPPLQMFPSIALLAVGQSGEQVHTALSLLSVAAVLLMLVLMWTTARARGLPELAPLLVLAVLASPFLWYGNNTFPEALAAGAAVAMCAAVARRAPWPLVVLAAAVTAASKETAAPFAAALAFILIVGGLRLRGREAVRAHVPVAAGIVLGVAANAGLNWLRFGSLQNLALLQDFFRVPGAGLRAELFGALMASPNGGVLWWWPAAVALGLGLLLAGLLRRRTWGERWPALALLGVFLALQAGLASYHTPFGWIAWGPRLTLPWIPALLLCAAVVYGEDLREPLRRFLRSGWRTAVAAALIVLFALPHLGVVFRPFTMGEFFATVDKECPQRPATTIPVYDELYYSCVKHQAWGRKPVLLTSLQQGLRSPQAVLYALGLIAGTAGLVVLARSRLTPSAGGTAAAAGAAARP